jgi:ABC-type sugar transport system ATPase subunit
VDGLDVWEFVDHRGERPMTHSGRAVLAMRGVGKSFPGVRALRDVDLTLHAGETLALLGENGAGKSTLCNILAGVHPVYDGKIEVGGERVSIRSPKDAKRHGIAMIHQELNLVPELSIADNVFLGTELRTGQGVLARKRMHSRTKELLDQLGVPLSPKTVVRNCRIAEQQLVEVAKALNGNVQVLIMDEPTSALADAEVHRLFDVIRELTRNEVGVVYISHRLEELEEIADTVTVLRDGAGVGSRAISETDRAELVSMMVGRPLAEFFPRGAAQRADGPVCLSVRDLRTDPTENSTRLRGLDFDVRAGEILGIAGLMGAGRTEVLEAVYGAGPSTGDLTLAGKPYRPRSPKSALRKGIALVAEDRKAQSLVLDNTVRFNVTLAALGRYLRPWRTMDRRAERKAVTEKITELRIKTPAQVVAVRTLSGGNQQKVVLAKCLLVRPKLLLLDEPTRGIDVGAKAEIHTLMERLAAEGTAIIAVSSELPELMGMCDRILVLCEGRLTGEFHRDPDNGPEVDQESILHAAMDRETVVAQADPDTEVGA